MKLPIFWKKYGLYIAIGVVIGLILGIIFWLNKKNNTTVEQTITPINSPFEYLNNTISFTNTPSDLPISTSVKIYKTTKPEITTIESFVTRFSQKTPATSEETYLWTFNDAVVTYSLDSSILFLNSEGGLVTDIKIGGTSDVTSFLLDYFNIREITITKVEDLSNGKKEFKGYYSSNNLEYGVIGIEGYALDLIADSSKLYSLSLLVLPQSNIVTYQDMPTRTLSAAISQNHEIDTTYLDYDANFKKQYPLIKASAKLKSFDVSEVTYRYIFIDQSYGYLVPMYEMAGDGQLYDSQGNKYWADTLLYMCALDSEYVTKVEPYMETNTLLDSGD